MWNCYSCMTLYLKTPLCGQCTGCDDRVKKLCAAQPTYPLMSYLLTRFFCNMTSKIMARDMQIHKGIVHGPVLHSLFSKTKLKWESPCTFFFVNWSPCKCIQSNDYGDYEASYYRRCGAAKCGIDFRYAVSIFSGCKMGDVAGFSQASANFYKCSGLTFEQTR